MSSPLFRGQLVGVPLEIMHPTMEKDTTYTKIFVGGLPYHTNDASLRKYFESFGDIDEAVVITDKQTGKSRGYGFVSENETRLFCRRGGGDVQSWSGDFYATSRALICVTLSPRRCCGVGVPVGHMPGASSRSACHQLSKVPQSRNQTDAEQLRVCTLSAHTPSFGQNPSLISSFNPQINLKLRPEMET